jgi:hypothetical protein
MLAEPRCLCVDSYCPWGLHQPVLSLHVSRVQCRPLLNLAFPVEGSGTSGPGPMNKSWQWCF